MKKLLLFLMLSGLLMTTRAQQDPAYSMYMFNGLYLNPAYAGSQEVISLTGIYRHQWVGLNGAPRTANLSVHMPFPKNQYAIGLVVSNDRIGLANTLNATPSFAYRLKVKNTKICFGIQASFTYFYRNNADSEFPTENPDHTASLNTNMFVPNVGAGIYVYGRKYFVGASVPHLMPAALRGKSRLLNYSEDVARIYNYYVFTAGYVVGKEESLVKFRPTILMKWQEGLPNNIPQFDFNLALLFINRVWVGASLRTQGDARTSSGEKMPFGPESVIGYVQVKVTKQFQLGYAYDASLSKLRNAHSGTHEIMLGYDFWFTKNRFVTPRFVSYF